MVVSLQFMVYTIIINECVDTEKVIKMTRKKNETKEH